MYKALTMTVILISASGCATNSNKANTSVLDEWIDVDSNALAQPITEGSRYSGMRDVAISTGVQAGLYDRSREINRWLKAYHDRFSVIFDFSNLLLPGNILPPVVTETDEIKEVADGGRMARRIQRTYQLETDPVVVTSPPTYLNYLYREFQKPETPQRAALPRPGNPEEQELWNQWVREGWAIGVRQANMQFDANANRLQRDFVGMQRYLELADKNVLSLPRTSTEDLGVTRSKDGKTLYIGDVVLKLDVNPAFTKSEDWLVVPQ